MTPDAKIQVFAIKRGSINGKEIFCSTLYPHYLNLIAKLRASHYNRGLLSDYIYINPKTDVSSLKDEDIVSFVPMTAVECLTNNVTYEKTVYSKVKKGFTVFYKGDMLWAKITPCMQNGKSCIVDAMPTNIGFGSTEFHVLRSRDDSVYMPFLWALFSNNSVLKAAQAMFNGSAGQQRVADSFFKDFPAVLPKYIIQKEMTDRLNKQLHSYKQKVKHADLLLAGMDQFIGEALGSNILINRVKKCFGVSFKRLNSSRLDANYYVSVLNPINKSKYEICRLGDIALVNNNSKKGLSFGETVPYVGLPECSKYDIKEVITKKYSDVSNRNIVYPDDILFARIEPSIFNKKYVWASDLLGHDYAFLSTEFYTIRAKDMRLQKFIYAMLFYRPVFQQFCGRTTGSTGRRRLDKTSLQKIMIPMPRLDVCEAIGNEFFARRNKAIILTTEAEQDLQNAREQFEKELLGE